MTDTGQDVFADETDTGTETAPEKDEAEPEAQAEGEGEKQAEPPAANEDEEEGSEPEAEEKGKKGEKLIPEHRMKAALKSVTDKLQAAQEKLAKYETNEIKAPDREKDPEGYERHVRIEVSKQIMADMHEDYDEMIDVYLEMAKANPALEQAVMSSRLPAKTAYDLAKKSKEIAEIEEVRTSGEWEEFQQWKKAHAKNGNSNTGQKPVALKVPNLNRTTSVNKVSKQPDNELFSDKDPY